MSTYARIQNGVVAEIISTTADPATLFNPALVWEAVSQSGVTVGWTYANGGFTAPVPPAPPTLTLPSLSQLQTELATIQAQIAAMTPAATSTSTTSSGG
jgi:hypothetical protein